MGRLAFIVNGIAFGVLIFAHLTGPSPIFPKGGDEPGLAIASGILFGANIVYLAQKLRAMAAYQEAAKLAWAGGYAQNKALDMLDVIQYHFNLTDAEALKRQREARTAGRAEPPKRIILAKNVARLETEEARPGWRSANVLAMLRKARRMPLEPSEGEK
jgi:hypothetical protein